MEILHIPPQALPKLLTAYSRSKTLGEHMQAFLSHYAQYDKEEKYEDAKEISMNNSGRILRILLDLHKRADIRKLSITKAAKDLMDVSPGLSKAQATNIVARSFGLDSRSDFDGVFVKRGDDGKFLDKSRTINVYQSLLFNLITAGVVNGPLDVPFKELKPYATPEMISRLKRSRS